jgi:hypothetical protein
MSRYSLDVILCALLMLVAVGCGGGDSEPPKPTEPPRSSRTILPDKQTLDLAALLAKPRAELATLAHELQERLAAQEVSRREGHSPFVNSKLNLPLVVPVFRQAKFSSAAGFSLPPYVPEGSKDSAVALHLARHGDTEAARQLVDAKDKTAAAQIAAFRFDRNYPVEWTRVVGLYLHDAQTQLAVGDLAGGQTLVSLHRQLNSMLGKSSPEPLKAHLLGRGKRLLTQMAAHWRAKDEYFAKEIEGEVASWQVPTPRIAADAPIFGWFGQQLSPSSRVLSAQPLRVLDFLELPVQHAGVDSAMAFFDERGRPTEILVTYSNDVQTSQQPAQFGHFLEESTAGRDSAINDDVRRRVYDWGQTCEIGLVPHSPVVAAFVRVEFGSEPVSLRRTFGAVGLDRLFESIRVDVSLHRRSETLVLANAKTLGTVANPMAPWPIAQAKVTRDKEHDIVSQFWIEYNRTQGPGTLAKMAMPLWERNGAARFRAVDNKGKGYVELCWEDGETRHVLTIPNQRTQPLHFLAEDYGTDPEQRDLTAVLGQEAERRDRFATRTTHARVPRHIDPFKLGMFKKEVLRVVPNVRSVIKREISDGVVFTFSAEADPRAEALLREVSARWDDKGRVIELRARYVEGPAGHGKGLGRFLSSFKDRGGAPEVLPEAGHVWADLAKGKAPGYTHTWFDDSTTLVARHDAAGVELILRDCPLDHPAGVKLPALEVLPRGPAPWLLGATRAEILETVDGKTPSELDGAWVLTPTDKSTFNAVLVWFDKDRVHRILARHRIFQDQPDRAGQAVREAWTVELSRIGWPWRQYVERRQIIQSLGNHDDHSRVRIFWQEDRDGFHLFTEWKALQP